MMAGLPLLAVKLALLEWFRASELSCDRAATLVNRDPLTTLPHADGDGRRREVQASSTSTRSSSRPTSTRSGSPAGTSSRACARELGQTHAAPVRRVSELMKWVRSGDYDRIMNGEYIRRGDPVSARAEAGDAAEFYAERFRGFFKDAGDERGEGGRQGRRRRREARRLATRPPLDRRGPRPPAENVWSVRRWAPPSYSAGGIGWLDLKMSPGSTCVLIRRRWRWVTSS